VWVGKFDGKDYPVTGDPTSDTRALKQIDAHTLALTSKKGGKVTMTAKIVVAADGRSRTLTASATDSMGMKVEGMSFYDKQ
jgi:flavin-dependent dehydrogenase